MALTLGVAAAFLGSSSLCLRAGESQLKQLLHDVNSTTGKDPVAAQEKALLKNPEAKKLIDYAHDLVKKDPTALSYNGAAILAEVARAKKDAAAAEAFYRVCAKAAAEVESSQKLEDAYFGLVELLFESKKYKESEKVCREALELVTGPGKPRVVVAFVTPPFAPGQMLPVPEPNFDAAKSLHDPIQRLLIKSIAKQGKFDTALQLADKMAKQAGDLFTKETYAWVLREAGRVNDAIKSYEEILDTVINAKGVNEKVRLKFEDHYRYILSNLYSEGKQLPKAIEQLRILSGHNPDEPGYLNDLGYIMADSDMNLDEAEKFIRKAIDLDKKKRKDNPETAEKDNGAYLDSLGWVLYKQKKYKDAKEWLMKAIQDDNAQHIEIYDHLGDTLIALGERDAALKYWQKGVELAGDSRRDQERKTRVLEKIKQNTNK